MVFLTVSGTISTYIRKFQYHDFKEFINELRIIISVFLCLGSDCTPFKWLQVLLSHPSIILTSNVPHCLTQSLNQAQNRLRLLERTTHTSSFLGGTVSPVALLVH